MKDLQTILQIVPRSPGTHDGVGDYAVNLARRLRDTCSIKTIFAAKESEAARLTSEFEIVPLRSLVSGAALEVRHIILHYVNYGFQKRGIPFGLLSILRELGCPGRLLTIFHELYASGPPWGSAFWLQPLQIRIARSIAGISDTCIVSSEAMLKQLKNFAPEAKARVHPVFSNFGEPSISSGQFAERSPHRWAICGGTALVERSLRSFRAILGRIPEVFSPRELFVLGGKENPAIQVLLKDIPNVRAEYRPQIASADASQILSSCTFAWLDYFDRTDVQGDIILKSSAFAAVCAHGVIPFFPHRSSEISFQDDRLPGPFFITANSSEFPPSEQRSRIAATIYDWYRQHASSEHLARGIAGALDLVVPA